MSQSLLFSLSLLFAETNSDFSQRLIEGVVLTLVYGLVGITLVVLGFKIFDWLSPKIDVQKELTEKQNIAVAVVCAAVILGICIVVAVAVN